MRLKSLAQNLKMSTIKNIGKFSVCLRQYHCSKYLLNKPITGYEQADKALQTVTGGRINRWLDAYEDFVGLTEVKNAQEQVTQVMFFVVLFILLKKKIFAVITSKSFSFVFKIILFKFKLFYYFFIILPIKCCFLYVQFSYPTPSYIK